MSFLVNPYVFGLLESPDYIWRTRSPFGGDVESMDVAVGDFVVYGQNSRDLDVTGASLPTLGGTATLGTPSSLVASTMYEPAGPSAEGACILSVAEVTGAGTVTLTGTGSWDFIDFAFRVEGADEVVLVDSDISASSSVSLSGSTTEPFIVVFFGNYYDGGAGFWDEPDGGAPGGWALTTMYESATYASGVAIMRGPHPVSSVSFTIPVSVEGQGSFLLSANVT